MRFLGKSKDNFMFLNIEKLRMNMIEMGTEKDLSSEETILANHKLDNTLNELDSLEKDLILNFDRINSVINKEALILITNINGIIVYLNERCSSSLEYEPNELVGKHTRIFKTGKHSEEFYRDLWRTLLSGEIWKGEITAKGKDGSIKWYFMLICPLLDDHNQPYQFLTLRFEITDQKNREEQALLQEKQLHSFMGILSDSVVGVIDQNGKILYVSPAVEVILGYEVSELVGLNIFDCVAPQTLPHFRKSIEELKKVPGSSITIEIILRSKKGSFLSCEFTAKNYLHDPVLKSMVFAYRDITEQKKFSQEIKNMVYHDLLTGLPNYSHFEKNLKKEVDYANENNTNFAIMQLGLDDFKYVNSTFGHPIGDLFLKEFSKRIVMAPSENISVYRMSGDLFIFLMKGYVDVEDISETSSSLVSLINKEPFNIDGNEINVSVSMGVSVFPYSGENAEVLLKNAEIAMYRAKKSGKNQYQIFSPTMNLHSYKQFMLRNDSKKALLRNEFCIYYQPRINPLTNEMVSAEALLRWNHPKWGMVSPDEFISMAEDSGLIVPIGEWTIRKVCSEIKKWEKEKLSVKKISINLSSLQLLQPNFVDMVSSILKELSVNPKWIEFEITETVIIEREEQVLKALTELKNLGMTIALDDFGTGYSSLNYLKKFPCEMIKIDKSLIKDIQSDHENHEIIASIITLCHKLKKSVVAEGVEMEEELFVLRHLGCDEIQGYIYSKPVDEQKYKVLLKEGIGFKINETTMNTGVNRRSYFRVPLEVPLIADMTIEKIGNEKISIGSTEVIIKNIGPGGLNFYSPLKLPITKEIILQFTTEILSEELILKGNIVWYKETESTNFQYGVEFIFAKIKQEKLIKILNNFQVKLRNKSILPGSRFLTNR